MKGILVFMEEPNKDIQPKQSLGLLDVTAIIIGIVIGAGIFVFPKLVAGQAASGSTMILFWVAGGFISLIGALCYAELATTYPHAGGDYHYLHRAYGNEISFLFAWARMMVIQPGAIVMMGFVIGDEFTKYFPLGEYSSTIYASIAITLLTVINLFGIKEGKWAQKILTSGILLGLLALIGIAFSKPGVEAAATAGAATESVSNFGLAMVFVLLTYGGWNEAAYVSAEIKNPQKNIARALVLGIGIVTAIYTLINFAYVKVLGLTQMAASDPAQKLVGDEYQWIISIILVLAACSTSNATIITGARSNFALGQDYKIFKFMGTWNKMSGTPFKALIFQGVICFVLLFLGTVTKTGLKTMVDYTAPAFWFFFLMTGISLFVLRNIDPDKPRVFSVPFFPVTPILFVCICVFMLQSSLSYTGKGALVSVVVLLAGVPMILLNKFFSKK
ncbi:MAG: APC family permease [bacterium]|nr:APC family permease [bacterium]